MQIRRDGSLPRDLPLPSDMQIAPSAPPMGLDEVRGELKKLNKHLRQMNDLKKQANLIAGGFYLCIVALGFV